MRICKFLDYKNSIKKDFFEKKGFNFNEAFRSERQVRHDVCLRELILDSRNLKEGQELTLNNVKYFALTLDGLLISYDKSQVKDYNDERSFPVFFKPSFLLNKLIKVLPIKTVDYKKAFIKAITTRGFYKNTRKSQDILKIVNYLKSKGIDDEKVIYNLISEDIFIEKFRENSSKENFNESEFIESELNREFKKKQDELESAIKNLKLVKESSENKQKENNTLLQKKEILDSDLNSYKTAFKKMSRRVNLLEKKLPADDNQININFEAVEEKQKHLEITSENNQLSKELISLLEDKINEYKSKEFRKWQNKIWWNLFWVLPLLVLCLLLIIPNEFFHIAKLDSNGNPDNTNGTILAGLAFIINFFFLKLIHTRFFSEQDKNVKKQNIEIPKELNEKLVILKKSKNF